MYHNRLTDPPLADPPLADPPPTDPPPTHHRHRDQEAMEKQAAHQRAGMIRAALHNSNAVDFDAAWEAESQRQIARSQSLGPGARAHSYSNCSGSLLGSSPYQRQGVRHTPNRPAAPSGDNWEESASEALIGGGGGGGSGLSARSGAGGGSVSRRGVEDRV